MALSLLTEKVIGYLEKAGPYGPKSLDDTYHIQQLQEQQQRHPMVVVLRQTFFGALVPSLLLPMWWQK